MNHDRITKFSEHYFVCYEEYVKKSKGEKRVFWKRGYYSLKLSWHGLYERLKTTTSLLTVCHIRVHMTSFTVRLTALMFRQHRACIEDQYTMGIKVWWRCIFHFSERECGQQQHVQHKVKTRYMTLTWNVIIITQCVHLQLDNYEKRSFQFTRVKAQKYWPSTGFQDGRDQLSNCIIRPLRKIKINKH